MWFLSVHVHRLIPCPNPRVDAFNGARLGRSQVSWDVLAEKFGFRNPKFLHVYDMMPFWNRKILPISTSTSLLWFLSGQIFDVAQFVQRFEYERGWSTDPHSLTYHEISSGANVRTMNVHTPIAVVSNIQAGGCFTINPAPSQNWKALQFCLLVLNNPINIHQLVWYIYQKA